MNRFEERERIKNLLRQLPMDEFEYWLDFFSSRLRARYGHAGIVDDIELYKVMMKIFNEGLKDEDIQLEIKLGNSKIFVPIPREEED